jgi:hypothetical protein
MENRLELTHYKELSLLLDFTFDDTYIDLHNCYDCYLIEYDEEEKQLTIHFKENQWAKENAPVKYPLVCVTFLGCREVTHTFSLTDDSKQVTLDNFNKGSLASGSYDEDVYFLLEFSEEQQIDVICTQAFFLPKVN